MSAAAASDAMTLSALRTLFQIERSSGDPELDQAALTILKLASPFAPFPPELAQRYRTLNFHYEWQFTGGRLATGSVTAAP